MPCYSVCCYAGIAKVLCRALTHACTRQEPVPCKTEVVKDNQTTFKLCQSAALTFVYMSQAWAFSGESFLQSGLIMGLPCISSQRSGP